MSSKARVLGELDRHAYAPMSVRDEIRRNLAAKLRSGATLFPGIVGFEETVIPQIVNALLARHDMIFLGLRGQAKTRIARQLVSLLDDEVPAIAGSPLREHPLAPASDAARRLVDEAGDDLPVEWIPRDARYGEKLATPDVTMADLIGDIDPLKAAHQKLDLADPNVIHYGIIPRTNRGVFAVNELPGLGSKDSSWAPEFAGGARLSGARVSRADSHGRRHGVHGEPRGLHQPRQHHHAA